MFIELILLVNDVPDTDLNPDDVVAGWTAFAIFGLLALGVAVLGFSLTKRLKNVKAAEEAGLYDPSDKKKPDNLPTYADVDDPDAR